MRFASLGSGSSGNGLLVEAKQTRVLLDCGFGLRDTVQRLASKGVAPSDLTGILVTHEHSDHVGGVVRFACKYDLPVWLTHGTLSAIKSSSERLPAIHLLDSHTRFAVGDIEIEPFPVPHDAREPVQYVLGDGARRLGVLTDTGHVTAHIETSLNRCDALVLECNHDRTMLLKGPYPPGLKQRVAGRFGHLDNDEAAGLLARVDQSRLQHVIAAHLSEQNNTPTLARAALSSVLNCAEEWVGIAGKEEGFEWRQIV